jgi:nicotinate phosphoribosyltransferase
LIDTYDIAEGARKATKFGNEILGVRIDSGDLSEEAKKVRKILDESGCDEVSIVLSSNLDEYMIKSLLDNGTPVKAFGIGTELVTSSDDPKLGAVYKLMSQNGEPRIKISEGKVTYPSSKQVYRFFDDRGKFKGDKLALADEPVPEGGKPLLIPLMKKGELTRDLPELDDIRDSCLENVDALPERYKGTEKIEPEPMEISERLEDLWNSLVEKHQA